MVSSVEMAQEDPDGFPRHVLKQHPAAPDIAFRYQETSLIHLGK